MKLRQLNPIQASIWDWLFLNVRGKTGIVWDELDMASRRELSTISGYVGRKFLQVARIQ